MNVETVKARATLSWAAIVKGRDSEASALESAENAVAERTAFLPGTRGSRACECRGQVLVMLAYYGWIAPLQDIDHPDADKHEGHVYVKSTDVAGGAELVPGQIVTFYLYADDQGLGAEDCRPEGASGAAEFSFRAAAPEFVLLRAAAPEFVPAGAQKAQDAFDADTDLSSDAGGVSEDLASDSEDSLCAGLRGHDPAAAGAPPAWAINLDGYEEDSEAGTEACLEVIAMPPPAAPPGLERCTHRGSRMAPPWRSNGAPPGLERGGGIGSAPWRSHGAPPGLERCTPGWQLACLEDGASWPRDLPWRRC